MTFARRHHPNPAREQWDRAERWFSRLRCAAVARDGDVEDYALVVLHHCWSMHDWLIKGLHAPSKVSISANRYEQTDVERLFQSEELQACRMMANAAKHLDLDPKMKAGQHDGVIVREYDGAGGSNLLAVAVGQHDLLELCAACMAQVRSFLAAHGWELPISRLVPEILPA